MDKDTNVIKFPEEEEFIYLNVSLTEFCEILDKELTQPTTETEDGK